MAKYPDQQELHSESGMMEDDRRNMLQLAEKAYWVHCQHGPSTEHRNGFIAGFVRGHAASMALTQRERDEAFEEGRSFERNIVHDGEFDG